MEGCQLEELPAAGEKLEAAELGLIRNVRRVRRVAGKVFRLPVIVGRLADGVASVPLQRSQEVRPPPLGLRPGETVRVRQVEDIRRTLDAHQRCAGLAYMPVMERFAGRSFVVRKRIERFFDERTRTMLKVRDVVILDSVFCEAPLTSDVDYGGCERTCFLFWKEDWLERLDGSPTGRPEVEGETYAR